MQILSVPEELALKILGYIPVRRRLSLTVNPTLWTTRRFGTNSLWPRFYYVKTHGGMGNSQVANPRYIDGRLQI